ncbi:MAG: hypothetical protein QXK47_04920 [Candidatus Bathyarchaeia archaeon]|nr:hypothetical protein [Candidatus Bathyarchaeota archaeon]
MPERKQKRENPSYAEVSLTDDCGFILEPAKVEIGAGYSISLIYDEEGNPIIDVKTYGKVDSAKVRRDIERLYPNAQIRRIDEESTVTIIRKSKRKKTGK